MPTGKKNKANGYANKQTMHRNSLQLFPPPTLTLIDHTHRTGNSRIFFSKQRLSNFRLPTLSQMPSHTGLHLPGMPSEWSVALSTQGAGPGPQAEIDCFQELSGRREGLLPPFPPPWPLPPLFDDGLLLKMSPKL